MKAYLNTFIWISFIFITRSMNKLNIIKLFNVQTYKRVTTSLANICAPLTNPGYNNRLLVTKTGNEPNSIDDFKPVNFFNSNSNDNNNNDSKKRNTTPLGMLVSILGLAFMTTLNVFCEEKKKNRKQITKQENSLNKPSLNNVIEQSTNLLQKRIEQFGVPGLSIQVSVDGKTMWAEGFGYADVENRVACTPDTVMRIASISKSLTMTSVAQLLEQNKLDLDLPIQKYLTKFPVKYIDDEEVVITTRHLLSHQSGIRHYKLKDPNAKPQDSDDDNNNNIDKSEVLEDTEDKENKDSDDKNYMKHKRRQLRRLLNKARNWKEKEKESEFDLEEYHIKEYFSTVEESMKIFQDDQLFFKPGEGYKYTTHGWTVVSGIIESASGKSFEKVMTKLFHDLGLENTCLEKHGPIIYKRARNYIRDKHGSLRNAPYVDNSYKWAGGGFLSTVSDLVKFGNAMLYSYQYDQVKGNEKQLKSFLKSDTVKTIWKPVPGTKMDWDLDGGYGLGWGSVEEEEKVAFCHNARHYVSHTGGAVGASSVLLILPSDVSKEAPKGVVVAIICNMQSVGLNRIALKIAKLFEELE